MSKMVLFVILSALCCGSGAAQQSKSKQSEVERRDRDEQRRQQEAERRRQQDRQTSKQRARDNRIVYTIPATKIFYLEQCKTDKNKFQIMHRKDAETRGYQLAQCREEP